MAKKLTRPQRLRLMTPETRAWVNGLDDEHLMGLHDLTHDVMDERGRVATERLRAETSSQSPDPLSQTVAPSTEEKE